MKKYIFAGLALIVVLGIGSVAVKAQTGGPYNVTGWAWSSNIGWISFNSSDTGAGGGPYSVQVQNGGAFSGYAWSPNIGWISFNSADLTGCSGATGANVNPSTGDVTGWIRAIAGENRTDGWDGCIELSDNQYFKTGDTTGNGGVTYNSATQQFVGYAWGGPVVGWLQFTPEASFPTSCANNCGGGPTGLTGTCTNDSNPNGIAAGTPVNFTVIVSGGTGSYSRDWFTGDGNNQTGPGYMHRYFLYNTPGSYSAYVVVTDTDSGTPPGTPPFKSVTIQCGTVTVKSNPTQLSLSIGRPGDLTHTSLQATVGDPFGLSWSDNVTPASNYSCNPVITNSGNLLTPTQWTYTPWGTSPSGSINLTTTGVTAGTYQFEIDCQYIGSGTGADIISNGGTPVTLILTNSTIREF